MRARALIFALISSTFACSRSGDEAKATGAGKPEAFRTAAGIEPGGGESKRPKGGGGEGGASAVASGSRTEKQPPKIIEEDDLKIEEVDTNPFSENVTLKLSVTPQVKTLVTWGAKVMARLEPGKMDAEIVRPRGSGPLDIELKAEGFMPHHARLYTDRNDKIGVRLYRPEEAPNLFGYNRSPEGKKETAEKQEGAEKPSRAANPGKAAKPSKPEMLDKQTKAK